MLQYNLFNVCTVRYSIFISYDLQSLESLTERCESALSLLGEALQSMDTEPLPDNIKVHKDSMVCFFLSVGLSGDRR